MATERPNWTYDGSLDFPSGIDSGSSPVSIAKTQCAFANNATFRGDFITDRPPFRKLTIDPVLNAKLQGAFGSGLFQGATSFKSDFNPESIVCSVAGRLFEIFPATTSTVNSTGSEISIPGDPNPASASQAWLFQAERWLIVQDGLSDPIFYDGTTSRRSEVKVNAVGEVAVSFDVPPIGGTVDITLVAPFTGLLNSVLNLDEVSIAGGTNVRKTTNYMVVKVGGNIAQYQVVLKNLTDTPGISYSNGNELVVQPSNLGNITQVTSAGIGQYTIFLSASIPSYVVVNMSAVIQTTPWTIISIAANRLSMIVKLQAAGTPAPAVGNSVVLQNFTAPNVVVGVLESSFSAPAVNANVTVFLQSEYTRNNGLILFVGTGQYQVISNQVNPPAPSTTVTIQNLNDNADLDPTTPNTFLKVLNGSTFFNLPELPPGRMGTYGMGRVWQSGIDGVSFIAGDIVGGSSGSPAFSSRDAVLKVTENTFLVGGGAFRVPGAGEIITAMAFSATLDASLGQGPLQIFTNKNIFSCNAPTDRTTWQNVTYPILTESLKGSGAASHYGVVSINADILFRDPSGDVRSQILSRQDFNQWSNAPISFEVLRILNGEQVSLMNFCSAIEFDNRMLMTCNPVQATNGTYWNGVMVLNFDPAATLPPKSGYIWEGLWTGLNVLQLIRFTNTNRAFALGVNTVTNTLEIYELLPTGTEHFDNGVIPIPWSFETPMFFHELKGKGIFDLAKLEDGEMYASDIIGKVTFLVEYRADFDNCWHHWHTWFVCSPQGTDPNSSYPQYRKRMGFGQPSFDPPTCNVNTDQNPMYGTMFQLRISVQGHCVINGVKLAASLQPQPKFEPPICNINE